jgi:hypothetical protein
MTCTYHERRLTAVPEWINGRGGAIAACLAIIIFFATLIFSNGTSSMIPSSVVPSPPQDAKAADRLVPVSLDVIGQSATVYINGRNFGKTPYKGEWPARREIIIRFVRPGSNDLTKKITVTEPRSSFTYVMESEKRG